MTEQKPLPQNWTWTTLGEIQLDSARTVDPSRAKEQVFELYSVPNFELKKPEIVFGKEIGSSKQSVEPDTVLLCKINPRINRVWIVGDMGEHTQIASTEWIPFFPIEGVAPSYLRYFLTTHNVRDFLSANASGVGGSLMRVKSSTLAAFPFPLAPLEEQQRIAEKVDALFSELDAGLEAIERAKAKVKSFRASLLRAATSGELSAQWREGNSVTESGAQLLERILDERRAAWEEKERAKRATKSPTKKLFDDESWKSNYTSPQPSDTSNLPELPESWTWASLEQLSDSVRNGNSQKPTGEATSPNRILRISSVRPMRIETQEIRYLPKDAANVDSFWIAERDLLFTRYNGSLDFLGVSGMVRGLSAPTLYPDKLIRVQTALQNDLSPWLEVASNVGASREHLTTRMRTTAGQTGISGTDLKTMPVPLPPLAEQEWIVGEVERRLSLATEAEATLDTAQKRAQGLKAVILARAFRGELSEQNPNEESADELLERIRVNRNEAPKRGGRGKRAKVEQGTLF